MLHSLLRLLFFYLLFRFLLKVIFLFIKLFWRRPKEYRRETNINKNHGKGGEDAFDYENVVDAEFKES